MRKGLLTAALLAVTLSFSAVGCGGRTNPEPTPSEEHVYTLTINNKEAMQAEWLSDDPSRTLNLTITKDGVEQNVTEAIQDEELTLVSSDTAVASVMGINVTPVGAGTATITATYGNASDSVDITITYSDPHGKSAEDPLTVAEAIAICQATGEESTTITYYVSGIVVGITSAYSEQYGNISFTMGDKLTDTALLTAFRVVPEEGVDHSIIGPESEVLVSGTLVNYKGNTPEINAGGKILSATQGYIPQEIEATVAQALAACMALENNSVSKDYYVITGYVVAMDGTNFYMSDTEGEITPTQDDFLVYGNTNTDVAVGMKVTVKGFLKHYVSGSTAGKYAYETDSVKSLTIHQTGIALSSETASVFVGGTVTLTASAVPAVLEIGEVTWASSSEDVATVDAGVVTGVAEGTATITATSDGFTATCVVTVAAAPIPATSVELNSTELSLIEGRSETLTATVLPTTSTDKVVWASSDETIATVVDGVVTGVAVGTANITATAGEQVATCVVTVNAFTLDKAVAGETRTVKGVVAQVGYNAFELADETAGIYVYMKNYDTTVVTAGAYVAVTGPISLRSGGLQIAATKVEAVAGTAPSQAAAVTLTSTKMAELFADATGDGLGCLAPFTVSGVECTAIGNYPVWEFGDIDIEASGFSASAFATALTKGYYYNLTGYAYGYFSTTYVTFFITSMSLSSGYVYVSGDSEVAVGGTITLTASTALVESDTYTWASSDETIATVVDGVVTGVAAGEATITATSTADSTKVGSLKITVTEGAKTSITLNVDTLALPTSYADGTATVDGASFTTYQVANYGNGMQFRYKNSNASAFYNTTALSAKIKSVVFTFNSSQTSTADLTYVAFGNSSLADVTTGTSVVFDGTNYSVTVTPNAETYDFIKIGHTTTSGAVYLDSVVINYVIA